MEGKNYEHLIGNLPGFSAKQIEQHIHLYQGYVKRLALIRKELAKIPPENRKDQANAAWGEFTELKRREAMPYNGIRLHELYFDALRRTAEEPTGGLERALAASFGSVAAWQHDLAACAEGATNGWVLLAYDRNDGKLYHDQVFEHSIGVMVEHDIVLAVDCWEHAFMIDFGIEKGEYLEAYLKNVDWKVAGGRYEDAVKKRAAHR